MLFFDKDSSYSFFSLEIGGGNINSYLLFSLSMSPMSIFGYYFSAISIVFTTLDNGTVTRRYQVWFDLVFYQLFIWKGVFHWKQENDFLQIRIVISAFEIKDIVRWSDQKVKLIHDQ